MNEQNKEDAVSFSLDEIVEWCGFKPNSNENQTNSKFAKMIMAFEKNEYLELSYKNPFKKTETYFNLSEKKKTVITRNRNKKEIKEYKLNSTSRIKLTIKFKADTEKYIPLYLDEIYKILNYKEIIKTNIQNKIKNKNKKDPTKDTTLNASVILLVFCYLKGKILKITGYYSNGNLAAYDEHFKNIGEQLGIGEKVVSKSTSILKDLNLIYFKEGEEIEYVDKKGNTRKRTNTNIFASTYIRKYDEKQNKVIETKLSRNLIDKKLKELGR